MDEVIKIKVEDLNETLVEKIKNDFKGADLEIRIHYPKGHVLDDQDFWQIIDLLDWSQGEDNDAVIQPAVKYLSKLSEEAIFQFQDILSEKLYLLDGQQYAENMGEYAYGSEAGFSADLFLYARCWVVAHGKELFESVLNEPAHMPKNQYFEKLLYLPDQSYKLKTEKELNRLPAFLYETFFNKKGWGAKAIQL